MPKRNWRDDDPERVEHLLLAAAILTVLLALKMMR